MEYYQFFAEFPIPLDIPEYREIVSAFKDTDFNILVNYPELYEYINDNCTVYRFDIEDVGTIEAVSFLKFIREYVLSRRLISAVSKSCDFRVVEKWIDEEVVQDYLPELIAENNPPMVE